MVARRAKANVRRKHIADPPSVAAYYALEIKDWDWTFSFGANDAGDVDGPYWDYRHLELQCSVLGSFSKRAIEATLHLLPLHDLNDTELRRKHEPKGVGTLELRKGQLTGSLYLPFDVLATALQMMIGDRWHFVVLGADAFLSGRASIKSYRLQRLMDEDDVALIDR
jgi:hypothetical protein